MEYISSIRTYVIDVIGVSSGLFTLSELVSEYLVNKVPGTWQEYNSTCYSELG